MVLSNIAEQIDELLKQPNVEDCQKVIDSLCSYNVWMRGYFENPGFLEKLNHDPQAKPLPPGSKCYADREITESDYLHSLDGKDDVTEQQLEIERKSKKALRGMSKIIKDLARRRPEVLRQLDFSNKVLCGINLEDLGQHYNERKALISFNNAYLQGAHLQGAHLQGASLRGANLAGANLHVANLIRADLRGANFSWATLWSVDLCLADLRGADLRGSELLLADLREAELGKADLYSANLQGADLSGAKLAEANLEKANLHNTEQRDNGLPPEIKEAIMWDANL